MALHDPESTAQEKAMALKRGRQKKIQTIDGQQVKILEEIEDEEEDGEGGGRGEAVTIPTRAALPPTPDPSSINVKGEAKDSTQVKHGLANSFGFDDDDEDE